jgi:hypothetical protein
MKKLLLATAMAVAVIGTARANDIEPAPGLIDVPTCDSEEVQELVRSTKGMNGFSIMAMRHIREVGYNANRRDCSAIVATNTGVLSMTYTVTWFDKLKGEIYWQAQSLRPYSGSEEDEPLFSDRPAKPDAPEQDQDSSSHP